MAQQPVKPATSVKITGTPKPAAQKTPDTNSLHFIFDKGNYRLLIVSIAVVAIGFLIMSGTTDIYSTTKIVIAPLVVLGGFALGFFAIFKKPSES
jgi:hypothetical protein